MTAGMDPFTLDALPWPVAVIGPDESVTHVNAACAEWLSVSREEATDVASLCAQQPQLLRAVRAALAGHASTVLQVAGLGAVCRHTHLAPRSTQGGGRAVVIYAEAPEPQIQHARTGRREVLDRALDEISRVIFTRQDYQAILDGVVESIVRGKVADSAVIYTQHDSHWRVSHLCGLPEALLDRKIGEREVKPSIRAIAQHQVVVINDTGASDEVTTEWVERYGIKALIDVEIVIPGGDTADFAIHYHDAGGRKFDDQDVVFMQRVSAAVSLALRNADLFKRLQAERRRAGFLSDLVERTSQPFFVERDDGVIIMANQAFLRLSGYSQRELKGLRSDTIVPAEQGRNHQAMMDAIEATGAPQQIVYDLLRKDGTHIPVEFRVHVGRAGEGDRKYRYAFVTDISQRVRAERARQASEHQLRVLLENVPAAVFMFDEELRLVRANQQFESLFGVNIDEAQGKTVRELGIDAADELHGHFRGAIHSSGPREFEIQLPLPDGPHVLSIINSTLRHDSRPDGLVGIATDITERKNLEEQIRHVAYHDALTGLPNRPLFSELLEFELARAGREHHRGAVLFFDLDRFKGVNDTLGHDVGDRLLQQVATRLSERLRASDIVARIGGDEFNVMLTDLATPMHITTMADALLATFDRPFVIGAHHLRVTTSIGIAVFPDDADNPETLRRYADMAMYDAKRRGGDCFIYFNRDINTRSVGRMNTEQDLRGAVGRGEMRVHFQPLVNAATGRVFSAEALVRWQHPRRGLLRPAQFLGIAQESGLIMGIEEWVLLRACEEARRWHHIRDQPLVVTVNLCARQFSRPDLPAMVTDRLEAAGLDPSCLQLEITEQVAMQDIGRALPQMARLSKLGVGLALDDFGTGYSSLNYLRRMPISLLKIDQSFVQNITTVPTDRTIIAAITALAHSMDISVLAEGVETEEQFALIRAACCDSAQGYLFKEPLEPESMLEYVAAES